MMLRSDTNIRLEGLSSKHYIFILAILGSILLIVALVSIVFIPSILHQPTERELLEEILKKMDLIIKLLEG